MDVNGTRFHLRLGRRDWQPIIDSAQARLEHALRWDATLATATAPFSPVRWDEDFQGVSLIRQVPLFRTRATADVLQPAARRGAGADRYGNVFWIADDRRSIRVQPSGGRSAGQYWHVDDLLQSCAAPARGTFALEGGTPVLLPSLSGLAVTRDHYLIVGTLAPSGLLIFDLHAAGAPCWWRWPPAIDFEPLDIAPAPDGGVVILDRDAATGSARVWRLDRSFDAVPAGAPLILAPAQTLDFFTEGTAPRTRPARTFGGPIEASAAMAVAANAVSVAVLCDQSVLLLVRDGLSDVAHLYRFVGAVLVNTVVLDAAAVRPQLDEPIVAPHAFAIVPDREPAPGTTSGRLSLATAAAAQVFAFRYLADGLAFSISVEPIALPLQSYTGKGLVAARCEIYYDIDDCWVALAEQPRYRYFPEAVLGGSALTFDGKEAGCVWHRLMLDACLPPGCEIEVMSRAADERDALASTTWRREPKPYRRGDGSELPFHEPFGRIAREDHRGTFELLFGAAVGRYLELRLVLRGDGRTSPRIRALRAYYPRFSYLYEYLPGVYREDEEAASFLDRWLANVEGLFTALEGRIERAETLFDPRTAPPEYLDWLAGWLGALLDPNWEESRQRLFLDHAWLLFRWRGTAIGLLAFLKLATDECPDESIFEPLVAGRREEARAYGGASLRIVEGFERRTLPPPQLVDPTGTQPGFSNTPLETSRWTIERGVAELHTRFVDWLRCRYAEASDTSDAPALARLNAAWSREVPLSDFAQVRFSPVRPANPAEVADWESFAAGTFEFPYPLVGAEATPQWREFLARRYGFIAALNQAHRRSGTAAWSSFSAVGLPTEDAFADDGPSLVDWLDFVSLALPIRRNAHRFTVLTPALPGETQADREQRVARVSLVVAREKPAHTDFEVRLFWALFQVGSARVGIDTVLGEGSRFVALVLDAGYLGQGFLAEAHPWSVADRAVIGRNRLKG